ncbi:hypothetical protein L7F22_068357 [Adiantum nelumboides]|nr:hypothetical protein [Adiantum nelumboides]
MAPSRKSRTDPTLQRIKMTAEANPPAKMTADANPPAKKARTSPASPSYVHINSNRVRTLKQVEKEKNPIGPVIYWMSRDQRSCDNWALVFAIEQANRSGSPLAVVFNLVDHFLEAKARHFGFMLRGLRVVNHKLKALGIPFFLLQVDPTISLYL